MKFLAWLGAVVATCAGCASSRDIPVLTTWPARPNTVVGYISGEDSEQGSVREKARKMHADALVLLSSQEKAISLTPPETVHTMRWTTFAVGGDSRSFEGPLRSYAAIRWRSPAP